MDFSNYKSEIHINKLNIVRALDVEVLKTFLGILVIFWFSEIIIDEIVGRGVPNNSKSHKNCKNSETNPLNCRFPWQNSEKN